MQMVLKLEIKKNMHMHYFPCVYTQKHFHDVATLCKYVVHVYIHNRMVRVQNENANEELRKGK